MPWQLPVATAVTQSILSTCLACNVRLAKEKRMQTMLELLLVSQTTGRANLARLSVVVKAWYD